MKAGGKGELLWPVLDRFGNEVVAEFVSRSDAEVLARVLAARTA
jgi:hypothetical protein